MERNPDGIIQSGMVDPVDVAGMIDAELAGYMPRSEANTAISEMQTDINSREKSVNLAAVARSGSYTDLSSKPSIPAQGVTSAELNAALGSYVTTAAMTAALSAAGVSVTRMTAVLGTGGTVTVSHGKTITPVIVPVSRFVGDQEVVAIVGTITATQVTLTGKRSRGTLLLTSGPFEAAASGDTVEVLVIGR